MKSVLFFLLLATTFAVVHYVTAVPVSSTKLQSQEAQLASWKSSFKTVLDKIERDKVYTSGPGLGPGSVAKSIPRGRKLEEEAIELQSIQESVQAAQDAIKRAVMDQLRAMGRDDQKDKQKGTTVRLI